MWLLIILLLGVAIFQPCRKFRTASNMGCPMFQKKAHIVNPKQYPFEELYRPWSWLLSSFGNIFILLFLLVLCYALFRRSRSQRRVVGKTQYRKVKGQVNDEISGTGKVKVLVTGGCGSFGERLIENLIKDGSYEIHCLDLFIPEEESRPVGVASFISVDLTNQDALEIALKEIKVDVVFHVAALIPKVGVKDSDLYHVNKNGTQSLLDICKKLNVRRFIYTSTCDVLMSKDKNEVLNCVDETWPLPRKSLNAYCGSKKEAEEIVIKSNGEKEMVTCSLRCAILGHSKSLMFREMLLNRGAYVNNGSNKLSLVDTELCAKAHILAEKKLRDGLESMVAGQVYHLAGDSFTLKEVMEYSQDDSGITIWGHPRPISIPKWLVSILAMINMTAYYVTGYTPLSAGLDLNAVDFLSHSYTFNSNKARKELGWDEHPSWKEVVEKIVDEYEEELEKKKDR